MEKFKLLISTILIAVLVAIGVAWQSPTKSYVIVCAYAGISQSSFYIGKKGRVEYPNLQEAVNTLASYGYRVIDTGVAGEGDRKVVIVTMEK